MPEVKNRTPRTHCRKGHELTGDNAIWFGSKGLYRCRYCLNKSERTRQARKRALKDNVGQEHLTL